MVRRISRCSLCNNVGHNSRTCVKTNGITSSESNVYHEEHGLSSVQVSKLSFLIYYFLIIKMTFRLIIFSHD